MCQRNRHGRYAKPLGIVACAPSAPLDLGNVASGPGSGRQGGVGREAMGERS